VAITTQTYRAALDAALASKPFALSDAQERDLAQSFSRGFTPGFLAGVDHQRLVHGRFPKSRGVRLGTLVARTPRGVLMELDGSRGGDSADELVKPGDGVVFDEGHPEQDEQGGRVFEVRAAPGKHARTQIELVFGAGAVNLAALSEGSIVWKTDDPDFRRRMERTYSRDGKPRRSGVVFHVWARVGGSVRLTVRDAQGRAASAEWPGPLEPALKHPLTLDLLRQQLGRLGETPFELEGVELDAAGEVMVPKSVLNDLRRRAVAGLVAAREAAARSRRIHPPALDELRQAIRGRTHGDIAAGAECPIASPESPSASAPQLYVLARTLGQLEAALEWKPVAASRPSLIWCDFEDVRRYREAVALARAAGMPIGLATLRVIKPGEEGLLVKIASAEPDAILVRNLAALSYFREKMPAVGLVGDFSLNAANELSADLFLGEGLRRLVPSFDLNWEQLVAMLGRVPSDRFEVVVHQHMPMFHMEHCVFAATLSDGKDFHDCGRPCDTHRVELRDRVGAEFPLLADTGCRNTVFNSVAQSAAEYVPRLLRLGVRHFRVELLRENQRQTVELLDRYARVLGGLDDGRTAWRGLQILNQLGVTRGTLES
jgi:putative protease